MPRCARAARVTTAPPRSACARARWHFPRARCDTPTRRGRRVPPGAGDVAASLLNGVRLITSAHRAPAKCTRPPTRQPAMYVVPALLALLTASSLFAQATVTAPTELRAAPRGAPIATVRAGAEVRVRERRGTLSRITLEGYIHRDLIGGRRDSFALSVRAPSGARLRESPALNAQTLANLRDGMGLTQVSRRGEWIRVRRVAWIPSARLRMEPEPETREQAGSVETSQAPAPPTAPARVPDPIAENGLTPTRQTAIRLAPQGDSIGGIRPGAVVVPLARERDWVRVRVEGGGREAELRSGETGGATSTGGA